MGRGKKGCGITTELNFYISERGEGASKELVDPGGNREKGFRKKYKRRI